MNTTKNKLPELVRGLGPWASVAVVVGTMVGTGIFIKPATMAAAAGTVGLVTLAWVIGGALSLFGALSVAELGAAIPEAGPCRKLSAGVIISQMFCPGCGPEYRPGFTHCADCDVDLVHDLPRLNTRVRKPKFDSETYPPDNPTKLLTAFIRHGWIPAGLLALWIGEKLPRNAQLPFYVFLIVAIIYYRLAGAQRLRRKWKQWSNH